MPQVTRQHLINMLGPMGLICDLAEFWLENSCLQSDTHDVIYRRFLQTAVSTPVMRGWLIYLYGFLGLEEAEGTLWHAINLSLPEEEAVWGELFESLAEEHAPADLVLECIRNKYQDWYYDEAHNRVGKERAYDRNNPWWED